MQFRCWRGRPEEVRSWAGSDAFFGRLQAEVALAAAKGDKTLAELASQHGVYPHQISAWKKQLLDQVAELFEDGRKRTKPEDEAQTSELYEQIGRLKVQLDWVKKKSAEFGDG